MGILASTYWSSVPTAERRRLQLHPDAARFAERDNAQLVVAGHACETRYGSSRFPQHRLVVHLTTRHYCPATTMLRALWEHLGVGSPLNSVAAGEYVNTSWHWRPQQWVPGSWLAEEYGHAEAPARSINCPL